MQDINENAPGIPDRLRQVIANAGLSQAKFAALIEEPPHRLVSVLRGQIRPPSDLVRKVIERCSVDAMWLLSGWQQDIGELRPTEKILINDYRNLSPEERDVMFRSIEVLTKERFSTAKKAKKG